MHQSTEKDGKCIVRCHESVISTPIITQACKVASDINALASSCVDGSEVITLSTAGIMQDINNTKNKLSDVGEKTQSIAGNGAVVGASAASPSAPSGTLQNMSPKAGIATESVGGSVPEKNTIIQASDVVVGGTAALFSSPVGTNAAAAAAAAATSPSSTGGSAKKKKKCQEKKKGELSPSPTNASQTTTCNMKSTEKKKTIESLPTNISQTATSASSFPIGPCLVGKHCFAPTHELHKKCLGCGNNIHVVCGHVFETMEEATVKGKTTWYPADSVVCLAYNPVNSGGRIIVDNPSSDEDGTSQEAKDDNGKKDAS
jgi:hypothetical protein